MLSGTDDCIRTLKFRVFIMYITDHAHQVQLIKEMTQLRRDVDNYEVFYHHPHTNQMWKSFFPTAKNGELGPKLLRHEPLPESFDELMNVCLTEDAPENATGLGIEFSDDLSRWTQIIEILEKNYSKYNRKQVRLFLDELGISDYQRKLEVAKLHSNISLTESDLKSLLWRSRKLKTKSFIL